MAIKFVGTFSKKVGLPGYSSAQFSLTVEVELASTGEIGSQSAALYRQLQEAVDEQIKNPGFVPPDGFALAPPGNGRPQNGNGQHQNGNNSGWQCSEKQRQLIEDIVAKNRLDKKQVEELAQEMFGAGVRQLNKLQASGLIDELLEKNGGGNGRHQRQPYRRQRAGAE